jgi:hypothetical protein
MDLSGRFDFWRVLIHTRAVTPPRAMRNFWSLPGGQYRVGWWFLFAVAVVTAGIALDLGVHQPSPRSQAFNTPSDVASPAMTKSRPPW